MIICNTLCFFSLVAPRIIPFGFGDTPIYAGQSAQTVCFVSEGDFPLDISWSFQNSEDLEGLGISISRVGKKTVVLEIEAADFRHRGNYTCSAKNTAGVIMYTAMLEIHGILKLEFVLLQLCCFSCVWK